MNELMESTLCELKKAGADRAQCWISQSETTRLDMEAGKLTLMHTTYNLSVTMRALIGLREGTVTLNRTDGLKEAAEQAVAQAKAAQEDEGYDIAELEEGETSFNTGSRECDRERLTERLIEFIDTVRTRYPDIRLVEGGCEFYTRKSMVANTRGVMLRNRRGGYGYSVIFGGGASSMNYTGTEMTHLDTPFIQMAGADILLEQAVREQNAQALGGKFIGDALLMPEVVSEFMDAYTGCFLSGSALIAGTSVLKDKLGQKVASERLSLVSDPFDERLCGYRLTGDGHRMRPLSVLKNGILESFVLSQYSAKKTGFPRSGNTGEHLSLKPGVEDLTRLMGGIKKGLLVGRFSGGHPNERGDITGVAKNSFLIENGQIVRPVKETMLSGNLLHILQNAQGLSSDTLSNGIRVNPWMRVSGVTFSG